MRKGVIYNRHSSTGWCICNVDMKCTSLQITPTQQSLGIMCLDWQPRAWEIKERNWMTAGGFLGNNVEPLGSSLGSLLPAIFQLVFALRRISVHSSDSLFHATRIGYWELNTEDPCRLLWSYFELRSLPLLQCHSFLWKLWSPHYVYDYMTRQYVSLLVNQRSAKTRLADLWNAGY